MPVRFPRFLFSGKDTTRMAAAGIMLFRIAFLVVLAIIILETDGP